MHCDKGPCWLGAGHDGPCVPGAGVGPVPSPMDALRAENEALRRALAERDTT